MSYVGMPGNLQPVVSPGTVKCAQGLGQIAGADPQLIRNAAHAMAEAFPWRLAPEGFDFWFAINNRLLEIAREVEAVADAEAAQ